MKKEAVHFSGKDLTCEKFRENYAARRHGIMSDEMVEKMDKHQGQCSDCGKWITDSLDKLFEE